MLNKRVHILFEKDFWNKLTKSAKSQNISAGEFIRRAVKEELERKKESTSKGQSMTSFTGFFKPKNK